MVEDRANDLRWAAIAIALIVQLANVLMLCYASWKAVSSPSSEAWLLQRAAFCSGWAIACSAVAALGTRIAMRELEKARAANAGSH